MNPGSQATGAILVAGKVKPWHVIVILLVGWAVGLVAGGKLSGAFDPSIRKIAKAVLANSVANVIYLTYIVAVPEFRHALRCLFIRPRVAVTPADLAWAAAVMLCWGYGLYHVAVLLPLLMARPDLYQALGFGDEVPAFDFTTMVLLSFIGSLCAPFGEELMYRGYLVNLWLAKRGPWFAVIGSSMMFGALHGADALFAGAVGVLLALVYLRYESLWPGILLHALYNFTASVWIFGRLVYLKPHAEATDPSRWMLEIVLAVLFFPAAWQFWRRFRPRAA